MTFDIEGLQKRAKQSAPGLTVYDLANGEPLVIDNPPGHADGGFTKATSEVVAILRKPANALAFLDRERQRLAEDDTLSEVGRQQKINEHRTMAQEVAKGAREELEKAAAQAATWSQSLYAPPKLEPDDVASALIDQEIRTHIRGLTGDHLAKYAEALSNQPRHLEAVLRSPVPLGREISAVAEASWAAHIEKTNPRVRDLVQLREAVAWGITNLPRITENL